ncbi:hypothetical protein [Nocardia sp. NPDC020380]
MFSPIKSWVGMSPYARLVSAEVGKVIRTLPESALLTDNFGDCGHGHGG